MRDAVCKYTKCKMRTRCINKHHNPDALEIICITWMQEISQMLSKLII